MDYNFFKPEDIFQQENMPNIKFESSNIDVGKFAKGLAEKFKHLTEQSKALNLSLKDDYQNSEVSKGYIKGAYESWSLIHRLSFIDKLNHTYKKNSGEECPKNMIDNLTIKDHRKLVVHQVASWLEHINTPSQDLDQIPSRSQTKAEKLAVLRAIFNNLRSGNLLGIQKFLTQDVAHSEMYTFLTGNLAHFDNCKYAQQTESEDVFLQDT